MTQEIIEQCIIGSMFGDGNLVKNKGKKTKVRFRESHSLKQRDYLLWKKDILSEEFIVKEYLTSYSTVIYTNGSDLLEEYYTLF